MVLHTVQYDICQYGPADCTLLTFGGCQLPPVPCVETSAAPSTVERNQTGSTKKHSPITFRPVFLLLPTNRPLGAWQALLLGVWQPRKSSIFRSYQLAVVRHMPPPAFFPTDALGEIANALNDLADAPTAELPTEPDPPPAQLAAATSNSIEHVATRLAAVIAGYPEAASSTFTAVPPASAHAAAHASAGHVAVPDAEATTAAGGATYGEGQGAGNDSQKLLNSLSDIATNGRDLSKDLAKELALVHAYGVWSEAVLSPMHRFDIAAPLVREIAASIFRFAIAHHIAPDTSEAAPAVPFIASFFGALAGANKDAGAAVAAELASQASATCHVWPVRSDARRHVLRKALAARYGTATAAPTAALIAGPPLIVFVREKLSNVARIFADSLTSCEPSTGRNRNTASLREWEELSAGVCVFEVLEVDDIGALRTSVSRVLKDAVKVRGLSPTLLVVDADPDTTICSGAEVLGAVCESYGARLHIEGPALAILAASATVMTNLEFDIKACVAHSHSLILDVGAWFGVSNVAVVSYFNARNAYVAPPAQEVGGGMDHDSATGAGDISVARVMALWWLLQRVRLPEAQQVVNAAAQQSVHLVDKLAVVPHLIEHRTVGVAANVLLSYAGINAEPSFRIGVNRAILLQLSSASMHAGPYGLTLAHHQNREWILFSPLLMALRHGIGGLPAMPLSASEVAREMVVAARRCEIAEAGASAFVALAKQSEHLEVLTQPPTDTAPLYFGAVRIVPLGLVGPNWRRDPEMAEQVSKYTCALSSRLDTSPNPSFDAILYDDCLEEHTPFVCIGPVVGLNSGRRRSPEDGGQGEVAEEVAELDDFASPDFAYDAARDRAREAAQLLCTIAFDVVHDLSVASVEATKSPDVAVDAILPGTFGDLDSNSSDVAMGNGSTNVQNGNRVEDRSGHGGAGESEFAGPSDNLGDVEAFACGADSTGSPVQNAKSASLVQPQTPKGDVLKLGKAASTGGIWERLFGADDDDEYSSWDEGDGAIGNGTAANGLDVDCFRP